MGKTSGKNEPAKVDPVYVLGLDANGKPRRMANSREAVSASLKMRTDRPGAARRNWIFVFQ